MFFNQELLNLTCTPNKHDKQNILSLKDHDKILQIPKVINLIKCKMKFLYHFYNMRLQRPKLQIVHKIKRTRNTTNDNESIHYGWIILIFL